MALRMTRRAALSLPLGLPFALASCGGDESPSPRRGNFPPLRYGYLPPINLNVQRVEMAEDFVPSSGNGEIANTSPVNPAETLFAMARDRLRPVAPGGTATFRIITASIIRRGNTLDGVLTVRLDVRNAEGDNSGFAEARVTAAKTGAITDQQAAAYDMLKSMMDDMNVELEFQLRNKLRAWLVEPPTDAPSQPVDPPVRLPPPPPPPPPG